MGRYSIEHSEESKRKLVQSSGRAFRGLGFGGVGVDGLAKGAGLTSGAFYAHFGSKRDAFLEALEAGLEELRVGLEFLQAREGDHWSAAFAEFYLQNKRLCDLGETCALPSLASEAERLGPDARAIYQRKVEEILDLLTKGFGGEGARGRAIGYLALLSGGVALARTVSDAELSEEIARSVISGAKTLAESTL